jgi:glutamate synthase (NADPH/NADH) large chain
VAFPYPLRPQPATPAGPGFPAEGLYDPAQEHDACGVAFVADLHGRRSQQVVARGSVRSAAWTTGAPGRGTQHR